MTDQALDKHIDRAQRFLAMQRKRSLFFANDGIFGDPGWELLLEIYIATEHQQWISQADLLGDLSTTSTIGSRLIAVFVDLGYVARSEKDDSDDICMTDSARSECVAYLDAVVDL